MNTPHGHRQQRGAGLLILLLIVISVAIVVFVSRPVSVQRNLDADQKTYQALVHAKQALIAYAATYPDFVNPTFGPGYLPCPDSDNDGSPNPPCGTQNDPAVGRLPWGSLDLADLNDATGQRLWYALSENYKNNPKTSPMNSDSDGRLTLDGATDIVALVFAPGIPVTGNTSRTNPNNVSAYLEGENADGDADFTAQISATQNDRILAITRADLMRVAEKRVIAEMRNLLSAYYSACSYYPYPAPFDPQGATFNASNAIFEGHLPVDNAAAGGTVDWNTACTSGTTPTVTAWLTSEDWHKVSYYAVSTHHVIGGSQACGACLTLQPDAANNKAAIILMAGRDLGSGRPSSNITNYLEGGNQTTGDESFEEQPISNTFNDQALSLP